jgi:hypothetical protein
MGFSLAAGSGVDASPAAADAMAGGWVGLKPQAGRGVRASALFSSSSDLCFRIRAHGIRRTMRGVQAERWRLQQWALNCYSLRHVILMAHLNYNLFNNKKEKKKERKIKVLFGYAYNQIIHRWPRESIRSLPQRPVPWMVLKNVHDLSTTKLNGRR